MRHGIQEQVKTYTRRPGESSVYNLSIVFDEPPAPAERDELGFVTADEPVALRLQMQRRQHSSLTG